MVSTKIRVGWVQGWIHGGVRYAGSWKGRAIEGGRGGMLRGLHGIVGRRVLSADIDGSHPGLFGPQVSAESLCVFVYLCICVFERIDMCVN